jgi:hypothetical protein
MPLRSSAATRNVHSSIARTNSGRLGSQCCASSSQASAILYWPHGEMGTPECEVCGGAHWVCEDHPDKSWAGAGDWELAVFWD